MVDETIKRDIRNLDGALERLGFALAEPDTSSRSSEDTALAFVHAMGLFWKVVKELLVARGEEVHLPREAVSHAHTRGWLDDPDTWIRMLKDEYELSGGTYDRGTARRVYVHVKDYYPELRRAHALMVERLLDEDRDESA